MVDNKMILNASNVELTKVHYYEKSQRHRNIETSTFSREVFDNTVNRNAIIKHNIFGHRWVLKISESGNDVKARNRRKIIIYVSVSCCILIAVGFGVWISLVESYLLKRGINVADIEDNEVPNTTIVFSTTHRIDTLAPKQNLKTYDNLDFRDVSENKSENYKSIEIKEVNITDNIENSSSKTPKKKSSICNCTDEQAICFKLEPLQAPVCTPMKDAHDPSGCGGLCKFNVQFCKLLDKHRGVYECIDNTNILKCPKDHFNCGNMCLHISKRCDGFKHCKDNTDEKDCECDLKTNFQCGNSTSCLSKEKKCDGRVDCWDSYDEVNCNRTCISGQVPCIKNGQCILRNKICDGVIDCIDGSDEPQGC